MIDWSKVETVLVDMDGTLLDLHFDNHFWLEHLPLRYSEQKQIPLSQATEALLAAYAAVKGSLEWYCLDYWQKKLSLDIVALKREVQHKIRLRPDTLPFLDTLKATGRRVVLLTNAHPDSLSLKVERTQLDTHIDELISVHSFGVAKESQKLWQAIEKHLQFKPELTLFVDDSLSVLKAAQTYGIGQLLAVRNPDSQLPPSVISEFNSTEDYRTLLEGVRKEPWFGSMRD
jgi:putative hydrolase of the HAD superfamily